MKNALFASMALVASRALADPGRAVVVNACNYDVHVWNTPAADGGFSEIDRVLSPGGSYSQQWTALTNGDGWSIKLSPSNSMANIMQYEYTYHNGDAVVWYDLSDVNGNPWNGDWMITSDWSGCAPKAQAYRFSTDDAYGMQVCKDTTTLTVTLCSGSSANVDKVVVPSKSVSVASVSSSASVSSIAANKAADNPTPSVESSPASSSTTLATSTTPVVTPAPASYPSGAEIETVIVTDVVTTTVWQKRHEHHARHPHARA